MYPQVFGKYVLERELARGGMARVLLATLRGAGGFEKRLVVKQVREELACDDDFVRRFVEEAKTTVALAHPNIVPVYELGVELGTYFLAMELVEGASLAELLRKNAERAAAERAGGATGAAGAAGATDARPGISPEEGAYVGIEVCRALDYAHRRMNVVHRDITPRNVMIDEEGHVKVIDFGVAAPVTTASTGQGVFGSPGHMPPEQLRGAELTPASDIFAVAALLMELWSGKPPFRRRTNEEIDAAMRAAPPRPSDVDIRLLPLDDVLARALALDPAARPQQADDLGRALRRFLTGLDTADIARHLGERVRQVRRSPPTTASNDKPVLQRPASRPTGTQVATRTFAARSEVVPAALVPDASTRRLLPSTPALATPPAGAPGARVHDDETEATRPLERVDASDASRAGPRRRIAWLGLAGAGLAVVAFFLGKGASTTDSAPPAAVSAPTTSGASSAPAASSEPSARMLPATTGAPAAAPSTSTSTSTTGSATAERAQLLLLGDGTAVTVDGVARGRAPAHVLVGPGTHAVLFSFAATGETKSESLTVHAGDRATLRADFTGVTPTVSVQVQAR